jgi:hypothetical protein
MQCRNLSQTSHELIINTIPQKASFTKKPAPTDLVNYGKYIVNAAACIECHTQAEKGKLIAGTEFGGGREFPFPDGSLARSGNITPDKETGIGNWTEKQFVDFFHSRSDSATLATNLKPGDCQYRYALDHVWKNDGR